MRRNNEDYRPLKWEDDEEWVDFSRHIRLPLMILSKVPKMASL